MAELGLEPRLPDRHFWEALSLSHPNLQCPAAQSCTLGSHSTEAQPDAPPASPGSTAGPPAALQHRAESPVPSYDPAPPLPPPA